MFRSGLRVAAGLQECDATTCDAVVVPCRARGAPRFVLRCWAPVDGVHGVERHARGRGSREEILNIASPAESKRCMARVGCELDRATTALSAQWAHCERRRRRLVRKGDCLFFDASNRSANVTPVRTRCIWSTSPSSVSASAQSGTERQRTSAKVEAGGARQVADCGD